MTLFAAVSTCFRKYAVFRGRAGRAEFWKFVLFLLLAYIAALIVNVSVFGPDVTDLRNDAGEVIGTHIAYNGGAIGWGVFFATLLPWIAVAWRRMHDLGKPGWLPYAVNLGAWIGAFIVVAVFGNSLVFTAADGTFFLSFSERNNAVALTGLALIFGAYILTMIWMVRSSDPTENKYGPPPHEVQK